MKKIGIKIKTKRIRKIKIKGKKVEKIKIITDHRTTNPVVMLNKTTGANKIISPKIIINFKIPIYANDLYYS